MPIKCNLGGGIPVDNQIKAGSRNPVQNDAVAAALEGLTDSIGSAACIESGSYTGTGNVGRANPCSLTFSFTPKIVIILGQSFSNSSSEYPMTGFFINSFKYGSIFGSDNEWGDIWGGTAVATWNGNTLSWYSKSESQAYYQLNYKGMPYYYVAIA